MSDKTSGLPGYQLPVSDQPAAPFVKGAYDRDVAYYTRHIESHPADSLGYQRRALAHQLNDDFDQAIADYTTAIRLSAENHHLLLSRGSAYEDRADERHPPDPLDLRRADEDFSRFIRDCPNEVDGWRDRARILLRLHEYDNAIADYTEAIVHYPDPYYYLQRGVARYRRGDFDAAIKDFDETMSLEAANGTAKEVGSRTPHALADRGRAFADKGEIDRAIADYDAAIRLGITGSARLYTDRGLAKKRKNDHRGAVADLDRSLQCYLLPNDKAAVLFERGTCHQALHDPGRAASDFADAVGLDPDHGGARRALQLVQSPRERG